MDNAINNLAKIPLMGWIVFCFLIVWLFYLTTKLFIFLKDKNLKYKDLELSAKQSTKELYKTEGKNLLDNQCNNAHHLLKQVWRDLYEVGKKKFNLTKKTDLFLLEDITHLIEGKLNYEVKCDLTRNHITEKNDIELKNYSDGKAQGYYNMVLTDLYEYNDQLPNINLPEIMTEISIDDYREIFENIYRTAKKIAGEN
jgi:hypothetical protein